MEKDVVDKAAKVLTEELDKHCRNHGLSQKDIRDCAVGFIKAFQEAQSKIETPE